MRDYIIRRIDVQSLNTKYLNIQDSICLFGNGSESATPFDYDTSMEILAKLFFVNEKYDYIFDVILKDNSSMAHIAEELCAI